MPTEDEMLRDGLLDTSESKRKYGGGRVMAPSEMGFDTTLSDSMSGGPQVQERPKPERSTYWDASEHFKRQEAARRRNRRTGPGGGDGGGSGGDPPKGKTLEEYEDKMRADYKSSGENYLQKNQPKSLEDFKKSAAAQMEFAQAAAVQDFNKIEKSADYMTDDDSTTVFKIGDVEYDAFTFADGSEYLIFPDADMNNLQPGDVIRLNPPKLQGG